MIKIAVRELAYYVYQSGNLTDSNSFNQSAIDGKHLHQIRQSEYEIDDIKEYYIKKIIDNKYEIHGYIDGIIKENKKTILEEIKTVEENIYGDTFIEKECHVAQLKIYGYLYLLDNDIKNIELNLLYIERKSLKRRTFKYKLEFSELEEFFYTTLNEYLKLVDFISLIEKNRINSAKNINFPYTNIREGQKEMMEFLDKYLLQDKFNFILAPTGIGKTSASIYVAIKKMINNQDKIFFLTAKTSGKEIAKETMSLLNKVGYLGKTLVITAKKKICLKEDTTCDYENCPFAYNFYDKLKKAIFDILENEDIIDERKIKEYSLKHEICSFEYSLNISEYVGVIIADYNYLFDPKVKLIRFFEEGDYNNLILIDETHNLVSRSQNMYSATLDVVDLLILNHYLHEEEHINKQLVKTINYLHREYDNKLESGYYISKDNDLELESYLYNIVDDISEYLDEFKDKENRENILDIFLKIKDYLRISKLFSYSHILLIKLFNNNINIQIKCLDASSFISNIIETSTLGSTFFSATLYPIRYYEKLLIGENKSNYLELASPFDINNLSLNIIPISTKYKDREETIYDVVKVVKKTINIRKGKYIVFFPSYQYLKMFKEDLYFEGYKIIEQTEGLNEREQKKILEEFNSDENILGLFVLGGVFSEGVDFIGNKLHGVIVVGVGYPQINLENEIIKDYFITEGENGLDFAYTYPGFNKVIQAVGRVIRTENDKGIALLIDDRYLYRKYLDIFPKHWSNYNVIRSIDDLDDKLSKFWNK